jgi:3-deoxy-D-manno-octulosonic-acid transferase
MNPESPGSTFRLLSLLLLPFWFLHAIWHGKTQHLSTYLRHRFLGVTGKPTKPVVWIHAASVGEVVAVTPLVKKLFEQGESLLFTSFTAMGYKTIQSNFPDGIESGIMPVDFIFTCRRFLQQHHIKLCLLMETELWPELLFQTANRNIPIIQINARLSEKSTEAPIFVRYILRRALTAIRLHLARNELDRQLLIGLGTEPENIKVVGNLKSRLDTEQSYGRLIEREYLLLASSHESEEAMFLQLLPAQWQGPLIVIAPRHTRRSPAIQKVLADAGVVYAVRSEGQTVGPQTQVYLADTLGELKTLMAHASLVVMGGSFEQTGGHNLIEPANLGCAIITGPSDSNIKSDIELLGDSIVQVDDMTSCWQQIDYWLIHADERKTSGERAKRKLQNQGNIIDDYLKEIKTYLD